MVTDAVDAGVAVSYLLAVVGALVGAAYVGLKVWTQAPVVGGEWWPYIRVIATVVGAVIAFKVLVLVLVVVLAGAWATLSLLLTVVSGNV